MPLSDEQAEGRSAADKFSDLVETAGTHATELRVATAVNGGLFLEQVERWR